MLFIMGEYRFRYFRNAGKSMAEKSGEADFALALFINGAGVLYAGTVCGDGAFCKGIPACLCLDCRF